VERCVNDQFKPVAYIKEGCPYSIKLLNFIEDADLSDEVDVVRCAAGTPVMRAVKEKLSAATGKSPKFPTVEIKPGVFKTESEKLTEYLSERYGQSHG
jgi:hypothetical protein